MMITREHYYELLLARERGGLTPEGEKMIASVGETAEAQAQSLIEARDPSKRARYETPNYPCGGMSGDNHWTTWSTIK